MKKIFSAFLLMTMMVFSVGSFVSCSDIEKEIATLDTQATENAAAIADLNSKIAALQTALNAAQADADAAQKAADAAAAAAAAAKADAIAAAKAEVEAAKAAIEAGVATDLAAVNAKVASLEAALALKADAATVELLAATLEKYKATLSAEDTELWTSVSELLEALTNLQGRIDAQEMSVEDLEVAVAEAVESVKAINTSLVAVYDILGVLANQIQSVVFVPEFDSEVVYANGYTINDNATNYIATATYEVRPAKFAESLTSENLSFASVDVKATKAAAAPEYFKAQLVSADATTGRIVVRAIIDDQADKDSNPVSDHATIAANGKIALSLNIASVDVTELLIAGSEPANIDVVSSSYVNVKKNAAANLAVGFPVVDGTTKTVSGTYTKNTDMPWNTAAADSKKNLFDSVPCVLLGEGTGADFVGQEFLSFAEANELLGTELSIKYHTAAATKFAVTYKKGDTTIDTSKKTSPIKVTGKTLEATAELVASEDYKDEASVGVVATLTGKFDIVDGDDEIVVPNFTATATYTITNKKSDFTFADTKVHAWSYTDGDALKNAFTEEVAVVGFEDIRSASSISDFTTKVGDVTYTATVDARSAKAVDVTVPAGLPYKQGENAVYEFAGTVVKGTTTYTVKFNVTLGAMPVDQVIDLGQINVVANTSADMTIKNIDPLFKARKAINDVDDNFNKNVKTASALTAFFRTRSNAKVAENDGVTLNGEKVKNSYDRGYTKFNLVAGVDEDDEDVLVDASTIVVKKVADYDNTITVAETYTVCGVDFTFKATIVTAKPEFTFKSNEVMVTDGVATVTGVLEALDIKTTADATAGTTNVVTGEKSDFTLNAIDLRNLVYVSVPEGYENDYKIKYTLKNLYDEKGKLIKVNGVQLTTADLPVFETYTSLAVAQTPEFANKLTWTPDVNELVFDIQLVSATKVKDEDGNSVDNVFATQPVTLRIPELVTMSAETVVNAQYKHNETSVANVVKALDITDKSGNKVYNPYAKTINDLFKAYNVTYKTKTGEFVAGGYNIGTEDFFDAYEMTVTAGKLEDVKVYYNDAPVAHAQVPFKYDQTTGNISLTMTDLTVSAAIKFEVPVTFTYLYDNYGALAQEGTAVVVFTQAASEDTDEPAVNYPTPDGNQWVADGESLSFLFGISDETAPNVYDFGTAKVTGYYGNDFENVHSVAIYQEDALSIPQYDFMTGEVVGTTTFTADTYYSIAGPMAYKFVPTDATSGVVQYQYYEPVYDETTNAYKVDANGKTVLELGTDVHELKYSHFNGESVKFYSTQPTSAGLVEVAVEYTKVATPVSTFVYQSLY